MSEIQSIVLREILDSRGNPTIEAEVILPSGISAYASSPSGASTGTREAIEKRDQVQARYLGKGVKQTAETACKEINLALKGRSVLQQSEIDAKLIEIDGAENKARLGANVILAVSLAVARAASLVQQKPLYRALADRDQYVLPVPLMNIINGGQHADNNLDFQEFMIVPHGFSVFSDALRAGAEVFQVLKRILKAKHYQTNVGDEGGFAPDLPSHEAALDLVMEAIQQTGYVPGRDISLALDVAASELLHNDMYCFSCQHRNFTADALIGYYQELCSSYPIISIEDGMAEDDWEGWSKLTAVLGEKVQLVGDDLFVTNVKYLQQGIDSGAANAILIKPNQIGTLTETIQCIELAKQRHFNTIMSHRSGETEDAFIADLAVAYNLGQIKTGSLCRSDRVAKYNQLLRIEEQLGKQGSYAGLTLFNQRTAVSPLSALV